MDTDAISNGLPLLRRRVAMLSILCSVTLSVAGASMVAFVLPDFVQALSIPPSAAVWILSSFQFCLLAALLPCSALGERIGYRRVFLAGIALFTVTAALSAFVRDLPTLVALRCVQGLGGAAISSCFAALLRHTYPTDRLGSAIGTTALIVGLATAACPLVGGLVVSLAGWPWVFAVTVPLGIVALIAGAALPAERGGGRTLNLLAIALNALFFVSLAIGLQIIVEDLKAGFAALILAIVALVTLLRLERGLPTPLLPVDLLRILPFRLALGASSCAFLAQMLGVLILPFRFRELGIGAAHAGLILASWPLVVAIAAPVVGWLSDRIAPDWLCLAGGGTLAAGLMIAESAKDGQALLVACVVSGVGFGLFQTPNNRAIFFATPPERSGAGGGMQALARNLGQLTGACLMGLLFSLHAPNAAEWGFWLSTGFAAAAGLLAFARLRRAESAQ